MNIDAFLRTQPHTITDHTKATQEFRLQQQHCQAKAERIVAQELRRLGWQEQDLVTRRKNDPTKLELAGRLRQQTTLPLKAIAARLHLLE
jgi:hypothetical protein